MGTTEGSFSVSSRRYYVIGIAFFAGLAIGVFSVIAIQNFNSQNEQSRPEIARGEERFTPTTSPTNASTSDSDKVEHLREIFKSPSVFDQLTILHSTLSSASERELKAWWIQSQEIERKSHREIVQDAILRKLATLNPHEALRYIKDVSTFQTNALLKVVFTEWSISQLDIAVKAATNLSGPRRDVALRAILETRDDLSETELHAIAQQLDRDETYQKYVSDIKALRSIDNPRESLDVLLNDNVADSLQTESLFSVAEAWHEQIDFKVLSKIYQAEFADIRIQQQIISAIAQEDLAGAFDYTRGLAEHEQQSLSEIIVDEWARTDAQAALIAISTLESTSLASKLEDVVAFTWSLNRPKEVIEHIEAVSEQFRVKTLERAFWKMATQDPLDAIAHISTVETQVGNTTTILKTILSQWTVQSPDAAANWVVNQYSQDESMRHILLEEVLPQMAYQDPDRAFELAIAQPTLSEALGLEHLVMEVITRENNIELAMKLLPRVRENSKGHVYGNVAAAMVRAEQTSEALAIGSELKEKDQPIFYKRLFDEWASTMPKNLYESLDKLSIDTQKSLAAMQLILKNQYEPVLTDEQIDHARTFLNSDDEAELKDSSSE